MPAYHSLPNLWLGRGDLPSVIDLEHFIESFLARLSNHVPSLWPPVAKLENVLDFCSVLISIVDMALTCSF